MKKDTLANYIPQKDARVPLSVKIPQSALDILDSMAEDLSTTRTAVITAMVYKMAKEEGYEEVEEA
jgi:hypothetical protein